VSVDPLPPLLPPSRRGLFLGFLIVGMQGFGGVMPFARRMLVEQRRWLSEREGMPEDQMCYPPLAEIKEGIRAFTEKPPPKF